ncbi:MAG: hypothetical protein B7X37_04805 [Halothiobacillus sp. 14-55-98]|nr:MAG: hypothetical protein B7X37_04805 [Halothiobacillus sp. 14-55-98]
MTSAMSQDCSARSRLMRKSSVAHRRAVLFHQKTHDGGNQDRTAGWVPCHWMAFLTKAAYQRTLFMNLLLIGLF